MPTFYNFRENGVDYSFDDVFVPADMFRDGNLWTWGSGTSGQLGNGDLVNRNTPVTTFAGGNNWKSITINNQSIAVSAAAIKTDGTLWVWGNALYGRLGDGSTTGSISTPITTFAGGTDWKQVSAGSVHVAAIKTDGTLWVWGNALYGRLGDGSTTGTISTPITTFAGGNNWKQVSAGGSYTAAIKTDGTLWTWGNGLQGRLGNAVTTTSRSTPVTTFAGGNNWKQVSAGGSYTAAIKTDGTLWVWGNGNFGRLGNAVTTNVFTPVTTFAGGTNWKQVSSADVTAAIKTDGTLWIWGNGQVGQIGNNSNADITSTPVTTFSGGTNWKQIACSDGANAAVKTDGTLWVWGNKNAGRLGINDATLGNKNTPVTTFAGGNKWKQVFSGGLYNTAAIIYDDPVL